MTKMERIERRERTRTSWEGMRERFRKEWNEAHAIILAHYGGPASLRVNDWYYAHACRMVDERWPDVNWRSA